MLFATTVFLSLVNKNLTTSFTRIKFFSASAGFMFTAISKLKNSKLPALFQESKTKYTEAVDQLIGHIQFKAKLQISSVFPTKQLEPAAKR